jgi:fumarate hydratase class II
MTESAARIPDLPVGIPATGRRQESDSMGAVLVPADRYWGAQTQRSLTFFAIGDRRMPIEVTRTYGLVKRAAATANEHLGRLPTWKADLITRAADEVATGALDAEFPLRVWQSGSGTQTNMNVNEVIANRCIQLVDGQLGSKSPIHPNDDVNMSQSTNDTFPTVMHIAAHAVTCDVTIPAVRSLRDALAAKAREWDAVVKIGRTHLQDATPLTVGQEWSGYVGALDDVLADLEHATNGLLALAIGGTAVGTGVNAPPDFGRQVAEVIAGHTGRSFTVAPNPFTALGTLDRMVRAHAALKTVAVSLFKIANDMRWLGSGPRAGLGELSFPANEPGSSIMPGKVNPSQAEALMMVCVQVMGADVTVQMAGAEGSLELNTFRPLVIATYLESAQLLADACASFTAHMIDGAQLNLRRVREHVDNSVMLVTALAPVIGYDRAADIAKLAVTEDLTLREAALVHEVPAEQFDELVDPVALTRGNVS